MTTKPELACAGLGCSVWPALGIIQLTVLPSARSAAFGQGFASEA
jgi:hypothetical protein